MDDNIKKEIKEEIAEIKEDVKEEVKDVKEIIEEIVSEKELIEESEDKETEEKLLRIRNIAVCIAMILFIISLFHGVAHHEIIRGIGYIFGAGAYFTELLMMTDCFKAKLDHKELFMAYCFFPMYLIFAITYILE